MAPAPAQPPANGGATTLKPIPISVATAETRPVQRSVETVGSLVPWQDVQVKTEQAGTVARLYADLGDPVGTVLRHEGP